MHGHEKRKHEKVEKTKPEPVIMDWFNRYKRNYFTGEIISLGRKSGYSFVYLYDPNSKAL
jgi:hypothetical protein